MFNVTKLPVIIVSAPRTGSSAIGGEYQDRLNEIPYFNEPYGKVEFKESFTELVNSGDKSYIVKEHAMNLIRYSMYYKDTLDKIKTNDCFLVRIRRRDVIAQAASSYIGIKRNKLHYRIEYDPVEMNDIIELDSKVAVPVVGNILHANKILDNFDANYDVDIYYEDLNIRKEHRIMPTPKPSNYAEILDFLKPFFSYRLI